MEYLLRTEHIAVRKAERADTPLITSLIRALALYEKAPESCFATDERVESSIFDRGEARVLIAEYDGRPVGFALYFFNYSTWMAKKGLYLEDLFVYPEMRGKGIGKALIRLLAGIARDEGCGRFEWVCLDWNEPSIAFYRSIGAKAMDEWTIYRLDEEGIDILAK